MSLVGLLVLLTACLCSPGQKSGRASDFYVRKLPGLLPGSPFPEMHAGMIESGTRAGLTEGSLFFWHIRATGAPTKRTIVWFSGGPGCSSMDGNLLEIGPFRFTATGELGYVEGNWAEEVNLLFVDQPFGTGYSDPNDNVWASSLEEAAEVVVQFFDEYADIFPEIGSTDVYLAGESFAGQYIPYIYEAIQNNTDVQAKIGGIKGLILGNPWIDPAHQYLSYSMFAKAHGLVPESSWPKLDELHQRCMDALALPGGTESISVSVCENVAVFILSSYGDPSTCFNMYKYPLSSIYPMCGAEWPPEVPAMTTYLSRIDVQEALHTSLGSGSGGWRECSYQVKQHLKAERGTPAVRLLPKILGEVPVLLLIGDLDFICNKDGIDRFVQNLEFNGLVGLTGEPQATEYGSWQSDRNLTVAHVTNGSHMVPVDDILSSQEIVYAFIGISERPSIVPPVIDDGSSDDDIESGRPTAEEISRIKRKAYSQASVVALCVIIVVILVVLIIRGGKGLSAREIFHAIMHTNFRTPKQYSDEFSMSEVRHPLTEPILEEDENEEDEFEV